MYSLINHVDQTLEGWNNQCMSLKMLINSLIILFRRVDDELGASYRGSLDDLLSRSDFVVLAVKLTPDTTGLSGLKRAFPHETQQHWLTSAEVGTICFLNGIDLHDCWFMLIIMLFLCLRSSCEPGLPSLERFMQQHQAQLYVVQYVV